MCKTLHMLYHSACLRWCICWKYMPPRVGKSPVVQRGMLLLRPVRGMLLIVILCGCLLGRWVCAFQECAHVLGPRGVGKKAPLGCQCAPAYAHIAPPTPCTPRAHQGRFYTRRECVGRGTAGGPRANGALTREGGCLLIYGRLCVERCRAMACHFDTQWSHLATIAPFKNRTQSGLFGGPVPLSAAVPRAGPTCRPLSRCRRPARLPTAVLPPGPCACHSCS